MLSKRAVSFFAVSVFVAAAMQAYPQQTAPATQPAIPPGEDQAKARLDNSPRHGEMVNVQLDNEKISAWIAFPERKEKAPVVIVIHEIYGLTDWIRSVADQLAADGFIAIAPDLLSGMGPGGGGTEAYAGRDEVVKGVRQLDDATVLKRLNAVKDYAVNLPAASGTFGSIGYCWGGSASFRYATQQPELGAAVVYYGTAPEDKTTFTNIKAPVFGFYGEDDARVTSTVEPTKAAMKEAGKEYAAEVYTGAGHGFLRAQSERDGANLKAAQDAWEKTVKFLNENLATKE